MQRIVYTQIPGYTSSVDSNVEFIRMFLTPTVICKLSYMLKNVPQFKPTVIERFSHHMFQSMSFSSYNFTQVLTFQFVLYNNIICIYRGYNILQVTVCEIENICYNSVNDDKPS